MSQFPTNKTVPLDKDIGVADAKTQSINTAEREQLSVVLDALDGAIAQEIVDRTAAVAAEATARQNADTVLQNNINAEALTRFNADTAEALARSNADAAEVLARSNQDTLIATVIDADRFPLRISVTGTHTVTISSATGQRLNANSGSGLETLITPNGALVSDFPGATLNFSTGVIGGAIGAGTFDLINFSGQASKWAKYAIVLLPGEPNSLLILPADGFGTTRANAPFPAFSGGVLIGIISVQDTGAAGIGTINGLSIADVFKPQASGSGSGSGGAGSPLDPQADETFVYYTRSDFGVDAKKFYLSSTGTEQILGLKKVVLDAGEIFISKDLTGTQVRKDQYLINQAQARLMYNTGKVDETPLVDFSLDGGLSWLAATVSLPGSDNSAAYEGNIVLADRVFNQSTSAILDGGTANGSLLSGQKVAAIVNPTYRLNMTSFQMFVRTSATVGSIVGKIYAVSGGLPTTLIATSNETLIAGQEITPTAQYKSFSFDNVTLESGTQYALTIEGTGLNASLSVDKVTTPPAFSVSSANAPTTSYSADSAGLAFLIFGMGADLRLRVTSGTAASELAGFGVEYVNNTPDLIRGDASYEERTITLTEASTGLITLNNLKFTPGAKQLMVNHNGHTFFGSDFTELSSSQVQFAAGFFQAGDVVRFFAAYGLVDGSSQSLGKINLMYDAVVGSTGQVASGYATHTSLQNAINAVPVGGKILLLTSVTEAINVNKRCLIEGKGFDTKITGTTTVSTNYGTIKDLYFNGNLTISGNGNFVRECFIATSASVTDSGTANSKLVIQE